MRENLQSAVRRALLAGEAPEEIAARYGLSYGPHPEDSRTIVVWLPGVEVRGPHGAAWYYPDLDAEAALEDFASTYTPEEEEYTVDLYVGRLGLFNDGKRVETYWHELGEGIEVFVPAAD